MPDLKISQLPVATTPLAGTELVPIVQGGVTDRTTVAAFLSAGLPVSATTLSASGAVTLSGGTANGVLYLDGSKVATSGSALTFDGTTFTVGASASARMSFDTSLLTVTRPINYQFRAAYDASNYMDVGYFGTNTVAPSNPFQTWYLNSSEGMRLTSTGLGIGTTPTVRLHTFSGTAMTQLTVDGTGAIKTGVNFANGGTTYGQIYFDNNSPYDMSVVQQYITGSLIFGTNNTECARITSGGDLLVGTQSQPVGGVTAKLAVSQSAADYSSVLVSSQTTAANCYGARIQYTGAAPNGTGNPFLVMLDTGGDRAVFRSNGGLANYSANDVNLSDRREKTNFAPAKSYLDTICAIPVQTFNYIDQSQDDPGLTLGVVAQDVQAVAPELVMESNWGTEDNPKMRLSIYQTDLQYALMKCIQEQQALITALTARVAALEKP